MSNYTALLAKSPAFYAEQAGFDDDRRIPPRWVLDREAELRITGGFDVSPSNICGQCFLARSVNGECGCS